MAFNFGEVLARQAQDNVQLQAQNKQSMMQMMNQLQMQGQNNLQKMEEFRQRKVELDLQSKIQAFREAQAIREAELNERRLGLEEKLYDLKAKLLPGEQAKTAAETQAAKARAGYYGAQAERATNGAKLTGQAGVLNATVRAGEKEIGRNLEQIEVLDGETKRLESTISKGPKFLERTDSFTERIKPTQELLRKKTATRDSLQSVNTTRQQELLNAVRQFQEQYGVTPMQAEQAVTQTQTQRAAFDPED